MKNQDFYTYKIEDLLPDNKYGIYLETCEKNFLCISDKNEENDLNLSILSSSEISNTNQAVISVNLNKEKKKEIKKYEWFKDGVKVSNSQLLALNLLNKGKHFITLKLIDKKMKYMK